MKIAFTVTSHDMIAHHMYNYFHLPDYRAQRERDRFFTPLGIVSGLLILAHLIILSNVFTNRDSITLGTFATFLLLLFAYSALQPRLAAHQITQAVLKAEAQQKNKPYDVLLAIADTGIHYTYPHGEGIAYWKTLQRYAETDQHFFLYTDQFRAYIIPKRAFATVPEAQHCIDAIHQYYRQATSEPLLKV